VASLVTYNAIKPNGLYHICSFAHSYFVSKLLPPSSSSVPSADVVDRTDAHSRVVWPVYCIYKACYTVRFQLLHNTPIYVHCTYHRGMKLPSNISTNKYVQEVNLTKRLGQTTGACSTHTKKGKSFITIHDRKHVVFESQPC